MDDAVEEKTERSRVGDCECAVFRTETPDEQLPLLTRTIVTVPCNEEGQKKCEDLCRVLARAADNNPDADARLCEILGHVEKLKVSNSWKIKMFLKLFVLLQPSIFARVCNDNYTFTGVSAPKTYCCRDSKPQICEQTEVDIKDDKVK